MCSQRLDKVPCTCCVNAVRLWFYPVPRLKVVVWDTCMPTCSGICQAQWGGTIVTSYNAQPKLLLFTLLTQGTKVCLPLDQGYCRKRSQRANMALHSSVVNNNWTLETALGARITHAPCTLLCECAPFTLWELVSESAGHSCVRLPNGQQPISWKIVCSSSELTWMD